MRNLNPHFITFIQLKKELKYSLIIKSFKAASALILTLVVMLIFVDIITIERETFDF